MPVLTVEKPLKQVLGDDGTDSLIRLLNQVQQEQKEDVLEFVEEKFERRLTEEISSVNERMTQMEKNLLVNDQKIHTKLLIWMFVFWITQIVTLAGLLVALLK